MQMTARAYCTLARDTFTVELKCPKCGLQGAARLSQADALAYLEGDRETTIEHLPKGFIIVLRESWYAEVDIFCAADDVSAIRRQMRRPSAYQGETLGSTLRRC